MTSKLSISTIGAVNPSGCKVLSDEYSYPILLILNFLILPIDLESGTILAFIPSTDDTDLNVGNFL